MNGREEASPPGTPNDRGSPSGGLLRSSARSANKARERMGQQKQIKLSFKDRLTDKVASGQTSIAPCACACAVTLLSSTATYL